jgi:ATP-dependent Clp protease ATP-binding subunit ClpX
MDGIALSFEDDALDFIVEKAVEYRLGARGLRSICEAILNDAMFELPSDKSIKELKVDLAYAEGKFRKSKISQLKVA